MFDSMFPDRLDVDITGYKADAIEKISNMHNVKRFVTTDAEHLSELQLSHGYVCKAGADDELFGIPIVLDRKHRIKDYKLSIE